MENNFSRHCASELSNFFLGFPKVLCGLCNRVAFNQNIFATEFILRIAPFRRISMGLHPVMKSENLGDISQRIVDFFLRPDVECAFLGLRDGRGRRPRLQGLSASSAEKKPPSFEVMSRRDVIENVARH